MLEKVMWQFLDNTQQSFTRQTIPYGCYIWVNEISFANNSMLEKNTYFLILLSDHCLLHKLNLEHLYTPRERGNT